MIRYAELIAADDIIEEEERLIWRIWIRRTALFRDYGYLLPDLDARLIAADGTIRGQALNVLRPKIEALEGEFQIVGGEDAIRYDIRDERGALITEGVLALYDDDPDLIAIITSGGYVVQVTDESESGQSAYLAVGQMEEPCTSCGSFYGCFPVCRYVRF